MFCVVRMIFRRAFVFVFVSVVEGIGWEDLGGGGYAGRSRIKRSGCFGEYWVGVGVVVVSAVSLA